jgi:hypothetical protein
MRGAIQNVFWVEKEIVHILRWVLDDHETPI